MTWEIRKVMEGLEVKMVRIASMLDVVPKQVETWREYSRDVEAHLESKGEHVGDVEVRLEPCRDHEGRSSFGWNKRQKRYG